MQFSYTLEAVIPVSNILGEGISWRPTDQTLWWTDIEGKTLYKLDWGQVVPHEHALPLRLCSFGFVVGDESVLIAAFENGFAYFWPASGKIQWLDKPVELSLGGGRRLNDGRVGPDGAFWAGSMLERNGVSGGAGQTGLYRLHPAGDATLIHRGLEISNGICWSPDEKKIYLADSPTSLIKQADFDVKTGQCGTFESFAHTKNGKPDGAIVDSEGRYWSALWGGHAIAVYDRKGRYLSQVDLPVPQPTIPVFGGPNLQHLIVASAKQDLNHKQRIEFPDSGNVFIFETNTRGIGPNYFGSTVK